MMTSRRTRPECLAISRLLLLSLVLIFPASLRAQNSNDNAVVQVIATFQEFHAFMPWQTRDTGSRYGYGMLIGDSRVITTEALVRNRKLVELRKAQKGEKFVARVIATDCAANLALLEVVDKDVFAGIRPVELADKVEKLTDLDILHFDGTGQVQHGKGRVMEISMSRLPDAGYSSLTFDLLSDLNISGQGAGVLHKGKLAGLIMSYDRETRIGGMLPYAAIKQFLDDIEDASYQGLASAGFVWKALIDPTKRKYLNVEKTGHGVIVLSHLSGSSANDMFEPDDVVMEWNGHPIDNLGFYIDPDYGRIAFSYLIKGRGRPGDVVPVKIIRDKKERTVDIRLSHRPEAANLIPENTAGKKAEYLVSGGFIMRELSGLYLRSHGGNWQSRVDAHLVQLYSSKRSKPDAPGDKVVILSSVLPDPINIGYQHLHNEIVTHVNSTSVQNLADVFDVMDRDGRINRLTLRSIGVDIVLDDTKLEDADKRISETYRISDLEYRR
jgi:S1-C subfamily serine protease